MEENRQKTRSAIKKTIADLLFGNKFSHRILRKRWEKKALILGYHRINSKDYISQHKLMPGMYLNAASFRKQLAWLKDNFVVVSVMDIIDKIRFIKDWNEPLCAITFDDGWYDNYEFAYPIIKEFKIPWTIFVTENMMDDRVPNLFDLCFEMVVRGANPRNIKTGIIELDRMVSEDVQRDVEKARKVVKFVRTIPIDQFERAYQEVKNICYRHSEYSEIEAKYKMLTWKEIEEMCNDGLTIGYHSKNHFMMRTLAPERVREEIVIPGKMIENRNIKLERIFSYPDGNFNENIIRELKQEGYFGAVSLIKGYNCIQTDPFLLRRVNIHEGLGTNLKDFLFAISRI